MSLADKADRLRAELGLEAGPIIAIIEQASTQLGLDAELRGMSLVDKADACMSQLGASMMAPMATVPVVAAEVVPMAVPIAPIVAKPAAALSGLTVHAARYGWARDLWSVNDVGNGGNRGGGAKDVTGIVRGMIVNDELHINANRHGQYMNRTFWPETADGPAIPRKLAVQYSYDGGARFTTESRAVPNETEPLHLTRGTRGTLDERTLHAPGQAAAGAAGQLSAQATRGCYVGACFLPIILTTFHVTPVGEDQLKVGGCSAVFGIPCPWGGTISRTGSHRFAGNPNAADPNNYQIWDFDNMGNCFCGKDGNGAPLWWAVRVCCC